MSDSDDVMARLMAVQPLPRGERLATWIDSTGCERFPLPLWRRLIRCSPFAHHVVKMAWPVIGEDEPSKAAALVRRWAAPLRRCREQRLALRNVVNLNRSLLSVVREENAILRAELKRVARGT